MSNIEESNNISNHIIQAAVLIAEELHRGQTDKAGVDYFESHLTTVGEAGANWKEKVVGYLHDTAEDTEYSVEQVMQMLKGRAGNLLAENEAKEIKLALELLNSQTASSREEYITRLMQSKLACQVKLNDLTHNMDLSRIAHPTEKDYARIKKYEKEFELLKDYLK